MEIGPPWIGGTARKPPLADCISSLDSGRIASGALSIGVSIRRHALEPAKDAADAIKDGVGHAKACGNRVEFVHGNLAIRKVVVRGRGHVVSPVLMPRAR